MAKREWTRTAIRRRRRGKVRKRKRFLIPSRKRIKPIEPVVTAMVRRLLSKPKRW